MHVIASLPVGRSCRVGGEGRGGARERIGEGGGRDGAVTGSGEGGVRDGERDGERGCRGGRACVGGGGGGGWDGMAWRGVFEKFGFSTDTVDASPSSQAYSRWTTLVGVGYDKTWGFHHCRTRARSGSMLLYQYFRLFGHLSQVLSPP